MSKSTVSDLAEIVAAAERLEGDFARDVPWWRGHANAAWRVQAQVFRQDQGKLDETALIGHFVSRAPSRSHRPYPDAHDHFGWLFLAQHYGLPTRLLDWSENPLVAAYFAVTERPDDDGCIWALWPDGLNQAFNAGRGLKQIRDPQVAKFAKDAHTTGEMSEAILAIDGQETDPRMLAQMSRFTLHAYDAPLEALSNRETWLRQYVIPKRDKARLRHQLAAVGVLRCNLFPDLENLAKELKQRSFK